MGRGGSKYASKSIPACILRSGTGLDASKWGPKWQIWLCMACMTEGPKSRLWGSKIDLPTWVQEGHIWVWGVKIRVQKHSRVHFEVGNRSGRIQMGPKWQIWLCMACMTEGSKSRLFRSKIEKNSWVQEGQIWVLWVKIRDQEHSRKHFEVGNRTGRAQMGPHLANLTAVWPV